MADLKCKQHPINATNPEITSHHCPTAPGRSYKNASQFLHGCPFWPIHQPLIMPPHPAKACSMQRRNACKAITPIMISRWWTPGNPRHGDAQCTSCSIVEKTSMLGSTPLCCRLLRLASRWDIPTDAAHPGSTQTGAAYDCPPSPKPHYLNPISYSYSLQA